MMSELSERELDVRLSAWRQQAERDVPIPSDLQRWVARGRRRLVAVVVFEIIVVLAAIASVWVALSRHADVLTIVWAVAVVVLFAIAIAFAAWNRRGLFAPDGETCQDYLAIAELRCARRMRSVQFVHALLAVEVVFLLVWGGWEFAVKHDAIVASPWPYVVRWALTLVAMAVALTWTHAMRRRTRRELAELGRMRGVLGE